MPEDLPNPDVATLTVQLLSAYLANNSVASEDLAELIRTTRVALAEDANAAAEPTVTETFTPAVSVRKSLASPEHIISLIDGKPYRTLKRHLASRGLTPDTYRSRYVLPASYPMVAPAYAAHRREIAQKMGLGSRSSGSNAPSSSDASISSSAPFNEQGSSTARSEAPAPETTTATRGSSKKPAKSRTSDPVDAPATPASADTPTSALPNVAADKATSVVELASEDNTSSPPTSKKRAKAAKKPDARRKGKAAPRNTAQSAPGAGDESANSDASAQPNPKPKRQRIGLFNRSDAPRADAAEEQAGADTASA